MKTVRLLPLLTLSLTLAVLPACGADEKKAPEIKTGGDYQVEIVKDLPYYDGKDADPDKHKLDLYLPKGKKDFPVLFFVHGGAWIIGDRKVHAGVGRVFAQNGVGAVLISYRLSPKVQHPEHIKDVARAFAWTHANIGKYGGKQDQIFVSGHSAGGHLVALLATDAQYLKAEKLSLGDIKGAMPLSGVYTIPPILFGEVFGKDAEVRKQAAPTEHVGEKHPPFLIVYADRDFPTCDQVSETFCKLLKEKNNTADTLKVKDRDHINIIFRIANDDDPATQAMLDFMARYSDLKLKVKEKP